MKGARVERLGILALLNLVIAYSTLIQLDLSRTRTRFIAASLAEGTPETARSFLWTAS
jgi:hypothetical protein